MSRLTTIALPALPLALALAACATTAAAGLTAKERRGLAFAEAHCAQCHAVRAGAGSPNPESPGFEAVANMPGLTDYSLRRYLIDSHNYPAAMNFTVAPAQADDLAAYVITLRKPGYKPEI